ncbi:UPF0058 family protein [Halorussus sp. MSC15.2]|uniref:UPF0058 family protein n=1 Tax=Halorussus sp. MSC15.2 TaxID=2283638 RepID=UPI0013D1F315|nr:UPF0058 family protein [Halorussus sp. MSC15.2]NEU56920.1 hypothetical protein [Halorussus sp. MSC15.2]
MRKVELIYLHALLAKTHDYLAARHDLPERFDEYETDEIGPYQIQRRKEDHESATRLLAERLADEVADDERELEVPEP